MAWIHKRTVGDAEVISLTDGQFRLDGGAMFGVVPRVLWEKVAPPDDENRIQLRINPLLIRLNGENILIETGFWDQGGEKFEHMYAVDRDETIFRGLDREGLTPDDIHLVINTHLHFDHAGRNVTALGEPTFPNARYVVQKQELHDARHPHERSRASYIPAYYEPIADAGLFDVVDGETELRPGLKVIPLPGHNLGQQGVMLERGGETLVYTADLLTTLAHAPTAWVIGYDLYPVTNVEQRKRHFPEWHERNALICTPHDPQHPFGRLVPHPKGGYRAAPDRPEN